MDTIAEHALTKRAAILAGIERLVSEGKTAQALGYAEEALRQAWASVDQAYSEARYWREHHPEYRVYGDNP